MKANHYPKALDLLQALIETPSFSGEEEVTASLMEAWLTEEGIKTNRLRNNIWAVNKYFDASKPSVLLNSHHDTVKPNKGYSRDPFKAKIENGKLYGLGSNDAGGCLVALLALFNHYYSAENLSYNLILAATAEEENSGPNGITVLLPHLPEISFALVGEPTQMKMAIAEKGLMVIDAVAKGVSCHAAHENTENAIYKAMQDIQWIEQFQFPLESDLLGKVKMTVTQIQAGGQHNVVPADCHFVIDVRVNECYQNKALFALIDQHTNSELKARSFRLNSSSIGRQHAFVKCGLSLGLSTYGSPTLSDQALINCPSLKMGPGNSSRSHAADEFLELNELEEGINTYIKLFENFLK
jgi:acetylornithine deacetylase